MPRLIMHKKLNEIGGKNSELNNKAEYGTLKIIALNLSSISGGAQLLALFALLSRMTLIYTYVYFVLNVAIMIASLCKLLRE